MRRCHGVRRDPALPTLAAALISLQPQGSQASTARLQRVGNAKYPLPLERGRPAASGVGKMSRHRAATIASDTFQPLAYILHAMRKFVLVQ